MKFRINFIFDNTSDEWDIDVTFKKDDMNKQNAAIKSYIHQSKLIKL